MVEQPFFNWEVLINIEDRIRNKMSVYNLSSDKRENQFAQGVKLEIMENNDLPSYISHNLKKYEEWLAWLKKVIG